MFENKAQGPRSSSEMSRRLPGWGWWHLYTCLPVPGGSVPASQGTSPPPANSRTSPCRPIFRAAVRARSPLLLPQHNIVWLPWEQPRRGSDVLGPVAYLHLSLILGQMSKWGPPGKEPRQDSQARGRPSPRRRVPRFGVSVGGHGALRLLRRRLSGREGSPRELPHLLQA